MNVAARESKTMFEMLIKERFDITGLGTALVGIITGHDNLIRSCTCDLLVEDQIVTTLQLDGEMLPHRSLSLPHTNYRAVSTRDTFPVTDEVIRSGRCKLAGKVIE
jgi:hypothetical protein